MATPYGLAYGLGAGLSGVPQAYMQGIGNDMKLQASEMQLAQEQKRIQDEANMNRIASESLNQGLGYGGLMEGMAKGGYGLQAAKLLEGVAKEKAAQRMATIETVGRAIGFGQKDIALKGLGSLGINLKDISLSEDGNFVSIVTPDDKRVQMPTTDAMAFLQEGKGMPNLLKLADQQAIAAKRAELAGMKQGLEQDKFSYKKEYDEQYLDILRSRVAKMGLSRGGSDAYIRRVMFRAKELEDQGYPESEARKIAGNDFLPGGQGPAKQINTARMVLSQELRGIEEPYKLQGGLNEALLTRTRDANRKKQVEADLKRAAEIRADLRNLISTPGGSPKSAQSQKPAGNIDYAKIWQETPSGSVFVRPDGTKVIKP